MLILRHLNLRVTYISRNFLNREVREINMSRKFHVTMRYDILLNLVQ